MRLTMKFIEEARRGLVESGDMGRAEADAMLARVRHFDFELDAAMLVEAVARTDWREWLCFDYGEEDPEWGGPMPHFVETWFVYHGKPKRCLVTTWCNRIMMHVENDEKRMATYPYVLDLRSRTSEEIMRVVLQKSPALGEEERKGLDTVLAWLYQCAYGPEVWLEEEPPPAQPLFVNADAAEYMMSAARDGIDLGAFYGPVFRVMLCTLSLLWADRETVSALPARERRVSRMHNREGRKQELPEHRFIPFTLLKRVLHERIETGQLRVDRERRRYRDHEVVSHWRRLRSGRTVPVRAHRRGDASLGTVRHSYRVTTPPGEKLNGQDT